ncbi:MAG: hypothetical protein K0R90_1669, partial [Oscillospiraceae bacterium]|nr:hypothetical protein [Oscillospiraceae bacterium]
MQIVRTLTHRVSYFSLLALLLLIIMTGCSRIVSNEDSNVASSTEDSFIEDDSSVESTAGNSENSQSISTSTGTGKSSDSQSQSSSKTGTSSETNPNSSGSSNSLPELSSGSNLHLTGNGHNLGDVHPFYDTASKMWYMYYLANIDDSFVPRLFVSSDMLHWTEKELTHTEPKALQSYFVLGVFKYRDKYCSYYGNGRTMEASTSTNLLSFSNSPTYSISNDMVAFPGASRDPYVFFDDTDNRYGLVATSYGTNSTGGGKYACISLQMTSDNSLVNWSGSQKELIRFTSDPECSQMFKLGSRWYLLASITKRSNNYVGCPSYWVGDAGSKVDAIDFSLKPEKMLEGEDLCAAQVVSDGSQLRIFGWVPKSATGGSWGGHLSLPRLVYAGEDGTLFVKLDTDIGNKIRGRKLAELPDTTISPDNSATFSGTYNRFDLSISAAIGNSTALITAAGNVIKLDGANNKLSICREKDGYVF